MSKLLLASVLLIALGIAIILFEGLVANNHANFHPCSPGLICDFVVVQDEFSIGVFPVIAGLLTLGCHGSLSRSKEKQSPNLH